MTTNPQQRLGWLLRQLRSRYEHPLEVQAYAAQVAAGLTTEESELISRYVPNPCRVLNVGCGAGREAIPLMQRGYRVVATDISRSMLRTARRLAADHGLDIACVWMNDPLQIPVPNAAFDCAVAFAQLLSHIPGRASRVRLLREIQRALLPGGLLLASITDRLAAAELCSDGDIDLSPLENSAGWEEGDLWVWQPSEAKLDTPLFFHLHSEDEIAHELAEAGLSFLAGIPGAELAPDAGKEANFYRYVVAQRIHPVLGKEKAPLASKGL